MPSGRGGPFLAEDDREARGQESRGPPRGPKATVVIRFICKVKARC
jgi:hypothetical protein